MGSRSLVPDAKVGSNAPADTWESQPGDRQPGDSSPTRTPSASSRTCADTKYTLQRCTDTKHREYTELYTELGHRVRHRVRYRVRHRVRHSGKAQVRYRVTHMITKRCVRKVSTSFKHKLQRCHKEKDCTALEGGPYQKEGKLGLT